MVSRARYSRQRVATGTSTAPPDCDEGCQESSNAKLEASDSGSCVHWHPGSWERSNAEFANHLASSDVAVLHRHRRTQGSRQAVQYSWPAPRVRKVTRKDRDSAACFPEHDRQALLEMRRHCRDLCP